MPMPNRVPVIASKPVAYTIASTSYSCPFIRTPRGVISSIGVARASSSVTLSRLKVS